MDEKAGWIKLWRKFADDPLWVSEPFTKGQAWVDLLLMAQGTENTIFKNGKFMEFQPGTVYKSILELSKRWKWSRNKVSRFLKSLENEAMVETKSNTTNGTTITIENWDVYQGRGHQTKQRRERKSDNSRTTDGHNKEGIRRNRRKEDIGASPASPLTGERVPAIGDGECLIELDGENHRFPKSWYRLAEEKGWTIEQYVRWRHQ